MMSETEVVIGGDVMLGKDIPISEDTDISLASDDPIVTDKQFNDFSFLDDVGLGLTIYNTPKGSRNSFNMKRSASGRSSRNSSRRSSSRGNSASRRSSGSELSQRNIGDDDRYQSFDEYTGTLNGSMRYEQGQDVNMDSRPSTTASSSAGPGQDIMFLDNNDKTYFEFAETQPKDPYFDFLSSELEPERAASKAGKVCQNQTFVDSEREKRKALKLQRERAQAAREAVRKQRADLEKSQCRVMKRRSDVPDDLRFSQANVVSYDIPGSRPYKCCGTFYVQPFSLLAPPKRITRTEQLWRDAGLLPQLPGQPGGFVTKEVKEAEQRKQEIHQLLKVPLRTHQRLPKHERWDRAKEGPKSKYYPPNITYPSGVLSLQAPTWDLPNKPKVTVDGRNLKRSNQFSQSGRILISGELPPEPEPYVPLLPKKLDVAQPPPKSVAIPPTLGCTSPAPQVDVRQYAAQCLASKSKKRYVKNTDMLESQDGEWKLFSYLPSPQEPPIGMRGDGTVSYEKKVNHGEKTSDGSAQTLLQRHAQTKSEISEAIEKYRLKHQPGDVLILHARTGEVRKLSQRNIPKQQKAPKEKDETRCAESDNISVGPNSKESHVGEDEKALVIEKKQPSEEFAQLFASALPLTQEEQGDWSCLSPNKVLSEWSDMSDWEAGLYTKRSSKATNPNTASSSRGGESREPRVMSAIANDELLLVRRDPMGEEDEEGSPPNTAAMWRSSRGQPVPPHTPPPPLLSNSDLGEIQEQSSSSILGVALASSTEIITIADEMPCVSEEIDASENNSLSSIETSGKEYVVGELIKRSSDINNNETNLDIEKQDSVLVSEMEGVLKEVEDLSLQIKGRNDDDAEQQQITIKIDSMSVGSDQENENKTMERNQNHDLNTSELDRPNSPPRNTLGQVSLASRGSSSRSKNSRPNTEEYMYDVYRTHIEQSGLFPRFVATSDPPASPLRYSPLAPKVSGDLKLVDPDAESAMAGLLQCGALPISVGATSDELKSLTFSEKRQLLSDKKQGRRASYATTDSRSVASSQNSNSSAKRLHRPMTITDSFKRELLKSGAQGTIILKRA